MAIIVVAVVATGKILAINLAGNLAGNLAINLAIKKLATKQLTVASQFIAILLPKNGVNQLNFTSC